MNRDFSEVDVETLLSVLSNLGTPPSDFRSDLVLIIQAKLNTEHCEGNEANQKLARRFGDLLTGHEKSMMENRRRKFIGFRRRSVP